ncbi:major histocompatibility complex class I-related gene protein isoform X2 [Bombina bombina]|uniref:major histocompatibility complex class I-related gene protein isoform X2 n=1 Tax=Bombina bombina TaxID=8345 RepID=UPI00235AB16C|nr:major histocompatibility complex class I-related gene protein isoform X2 [Bombina bombina]
MSLQEFYQKTKESLLIEIRRSHVLTLHTIKKSADSIIKRPYYRYLQKVQTGTYDDMFSHFKSFERANEMVDHENGKIKEHGKGAFSDFKTHNANSENCDVEEFKASEKIKKLQLWSILSVKGTSTKGYSEICYNYLFRKCQDGEPHSSGDSTGINEKWNKQNTGNANKKYSAEESADYRSCKEFKKSSSTDLFQQKKTHGTKFKWIFLYLHFLLSAPLSTCGYHSLSYYHSGVSERTPGLPQFLAVGYMDDEQIDSYNSDTRELIPVTKWIKNNTDVSYWKRQMTYRRGWEEVFKEDLMILNGRFNKTEGLHTFQLMYGCGLDDDGNTEGHYQYGYDGGNFIDLDLDKLLWVPYTHEAEISTQRWNREQHVANRVHSYLKNGCIKALKNYISLAGEKRKVVPQVKVSSHQSDTVTKLHCRVHGFYPKAVDIKWVKNGEIELIPEEAAQVLPNPDGTYQLRVTVEVIPKDGDSFSCHVDHSSLKEPLTVLWEPKRDFQTHLYIIIAVGLLMIACAGSILYILHRNKNILYTGKEWSPYKRKKRNLYTRGKDFKLRFTSVRL